MSLLISLIGLAIVVFLGLFAISIAIYAIGAAVGVAGLTIAGAISLFRLLLNPYLIILIVGLHVFDNTLIQGIFWLLFAHLTVSKVKSQGADEVKEKIQNLLQSSNGIVLAKEIYSIQPEFSTTQFFHGLICKKLSQEYIEDEIKAGRILSGTLIDRKEYCYFEDSLKQFTQSTQEEVSKETEAFIKKFGIVYEKAVIEKTTNEFLHDLIPLKTAYVKEYFSDCIKPYLENGTLQKVIQDNAHTEVYAYSEILLEKWKSLKDKYRIDEHTFSKLFGQHSVQIQKVILDFVKKAGSYRYKYEYDVQSSMWLEVNHTCFRCKKTFSNLQKYGPHKYCQSCLDEVHSEEEADLSQGKTVKKYVSAPPPSARIRRIE